MTALELTSQLVRPVLNHATLRRVLLRIVDAHMDVFFGVGWRRHVEVVQLQDGRFEGKADDDERKKVARRASDAAGGFQPFYDGRGAKARLV